MTVYYINSTSGSDKNAGTSAGQAFASLKAMDTIKLKAGDSVLLAANNVFEGQLTLKGSGSETNPITIGSYGDGDQPVITGGAVGIHGSKTAFVTVQNIAIEHTKGNAIYAGNAHDWVIDNVTVSDTGSSSKAGSISIQSSYNITIKNSTITGVHNDGVWMENVTGVKLTGNTIGNSIGHTADAVQLNKATDVLVQNNVLDMTNASNSSKGVLVLVDTRNAVIDSNIVKGGGFGIAAYGENVTITHNEISDYKGYSWSYGIGLGQQSDAKNYTISGNYIHDGIWGVSISSPAGDNVLRTNIEIFGNLFEDLKSAALKVDRVATGSFHDNIIADSVKDTFISSLITKLNGVNVTGSTISSDIKSLIDTLLGKTPLTNGTHETVDLPTTPTPEHTSPDTVVSEPKVIVQIPETPNVPVTPVIKVPVLVDPVPLVVVTTPVVTPVKAVPIAAKDDLISFNGDKGLIITGNLLDNDHSDNGVLSLRNVNGTSFKKSPVLTIDSAHGTLKIESDGDFSFRIDLDSLSDGAGTVRDTFQYKVSNGAILDVGNLAISIDTHHMLTTYADHLL